MATYSHIWIKINDEDKGTEKEPKNIKLAKNNFPIPKTRIPKKGYDYIYTYCHFDGYLDGVGLELYKNYNSYDKALNLILCGQLSYIENGEVVSYKAWRNDDAPCFKSVSFAPQGFFDYVFENGEWYIYNNKTLKSLKKYLKEKKIIS